MMIRISLKSFVLSFLIVYCKLISSIKQSNLSLSVSGWVTCRCGDFLCKWYSVILNVKKCNNMNSLKYSVLSPTYMAGVSRDIDLPVQYHPILVISPVISLGFFHMMLHVCFSENYLQVKGKSFVFLVLYFDIDIPHPIAPGKWKITFGRDIEVNHLMRATHILYFFTLMVNCFLISILKCVSILWKYYNFTNLCFHSMHSGWAQMLLIGLLKSALSCSDASESCMEI